MTRSVSRSLCDSWASSDTHWRGHEKKLFKKRFRLDVRKYVFSNRVDRWNQLPEKCIYLKVGRLTGLTDFSQHPVPTHPSPQRSTLLRWGDGWMGTGCWYSGLPHGSCSMQHAACITAICNLWSHINYSSSRQGSATWCDAATCGLSVGIDKPMLCACCIYRSPRFDTQTLSRRVAYAQATCRLFVHVGLG